MAGSRRSTRSKTGTKRATSSKASGKGSGKRTSTTRSSAKTVKARTNKRETDHLRDNYDPSLIMFLSIVIISVIYYFLIANAGEGIGIIGSFFFGLFGYMAYILPVAIVAAYLLNVNNRSVLVGNIKSLCVCVLFVVLCTYSQLFTGKNQEIIAFSDYYVYSAEYGNGGGVTGGLIHSMFKEVGGGSIWCFLILLILFILCFVGITGKQFVRNTREFFSEFFENLKDGYYEDQIRREERFEKGLAKRENKQRKAEEKREQRKERRKQREEYQEKLRRERVVSGVSLDTQLVNDEAKITRLNSAMPTPDDYGLNKTSEEITAKINTPVSMEELKANAPYIKDPSAGNGPEILNVSFDNATAYSEMINMKPQAKSDSFAMPTVSEPSGYDNYNDIRNDNMNNEQDSDLASYADSYSDLHADSYTDSYQDLNSSKTVVINKHSSDNDKEVRPVGGTRTYEERVFTGPNVDKVTTNGESLNPWTSNKNDGLPGSSDKLVVNLDDVKTSPADNREKEPASSDDNDDLKTLIKIPLEDKEPGSRGMERNGFSSSYRSHSETDSISVKRNTHEGLFKNSPDAMHEISISFSENADDNIIENRIENRTDNKAEVHEEGTGLNQDSDNSVSRITIKRDPHINAMADGGLRREHRIHILDDFIDNSGAKISSDNDLEKESSDDFESNDGKNEKERLSDIFDDEKSDNSSYLEKLFESKKADEDKKTDENTTTDEDIDDSESDDAVDRFFEKMADISGNKSDNNSDDDSKNEADEKFNANISFSGINKPGNSFTPVEENTEKQEITKSVSIPVKNRGEYSFPPLDLLREGKVNENMETEEELHETAADLQRTLKTFGVNVEMKEINQGPSITRFEMIPEEGTKVSKITKLTDDIKLNMAAKDVRIEAPIPGKKAVGIELPNKEVTPVVFRELIDTDTFREASSKVSFAVGKSLTGETVVTDIAKMPHVLIAGTTGSGKSVCINTLIMSILYKARPDEVKLILVDPKVVELSIYNGIPHLLIPVVTDPKKASAALKWACAEMDDRYQKFADYGVRNLKGYNEKIAKMTDVPTEDRPEKMYQMVVVVDELADLMMVASKEVEEAICRLAQKARACGIHLVIATQRPSVDVITGLIKANFPSRIAFAVNSQIDSRTILDSAGAERLLGKGDMLFAPQGQKPERLQGAFIDDDEVTAVVDFLKENAGGEQYNNEVMEKVESQSNASSSAEEAQRLGTSSDDNGMDELFVDVAKFCIERDKASASVIQRKFRLGWNRAARIMDQLYEAGIISGEEGTKPRRVLVSMEEFENGLEQGDY